jgi:nitroreductase
MIKIHMPTFNKPITEIIPQRFSCRTYLELPIDEGTRQRLLDFMNTRQGGPFGSHPRFSLIAATEQDRSALRGLGTYGFIRGASGFILGAVEPAEKDLEDYGYLMERILLFATALDLGTCWLGGTFTQSSFARKISLTGKEVMPAVASIGYIANPEKARNGLVRQLADSHHRLSWERLFFDRQFGLPLKREDAGEYATPLEMVRLGPSASNKQPWRIVRDGSALHFYLGRTPGYREGFFQVLLKLVDLQRMDMGIAMCHFELTAREAGLKGEWVVDEPEIEKPDGLTEYMVSWKSL